MPVGVRVECVLVFNERELVLPEKKTGEDIDDMWKKKPEIRDDIWGCYAMPCNFNTAKQPLFQNRSLNLICHLIERSDLRKGFGEFPRTFS